MSNLGGADEEVVDLSTGDKVPFKFKRLQEYQPGESWILMVYGGSKSGKTHFAGTCGGDTLFINIGDGLETLHTKYFRERFPDSSKMIVVDINKKQLKSSEEVFDQITDSIDYALSHFSSSFNKVVLDEATALRKYALNKAMALNTAARTTSSRKSRAEEYVKADVGDFGVEMDMIEWFLGQYIPIFKEEKKHFLMLAHERQIYGKRTKKRYETPLQKQVPRFSA